MYRRSTVEIRLPVGNDVACAYPVADGREDSDEAGSQPQVLNAAASSLARGSSPSSSAPSSPVATRHRRPHALVLVRRRRRLRQSTYYSRMDGGSEWHRGPGSLRRPRGRPRRGHRLLQHCSRVPPPLIRIGRNALITGRLGGNAHQVHAPTSPGPAENRSLFQPMHKYTSERAQSLRDLFIHSPDR